jgi:hypothetical protein
VRLKNRNEAGKLYSKSEVSDEGSRNTKKAFSIPYGRIRSEPKTRHPPVRHGQIALAADRTHVHRRRHVYRRGETDRDTSPDHLRNARADDATIGSSSLRAVRGEH